MAARLLIDGEWTEASDGGVDEIRNPATGDLIDAVARATPDDVARAVAAAQEGKRRVAALSSRERAAILLRTADAIEARQEELARLLVRENGKTLREIRGELDVTVRIFRGYAEEAKRLLGRVTPLDSIPGHEHSVAITMRQPRGVIAAIVPFNYPPPIPGAPPRLSRLPAGCAMAPRCLWRRDRCDREVPLLRTIGAARAAACHFAEEIGND